MQGSIGGGLEGEVMTAGEGEWVEVDEARAEARGAMDEGMRPEGGVGGRGGFFRSVCGYDCDFCEGSYS